MVETSCDSDKYQFQSLICGGTCLFPPAETLKFACGHHFLLLAKPPTLPHVILLLVTLEWLVSTVSSSRGPIVPLIQMHKQQHFEQKCHAVHMKLIEENLKTLDPFAFLSQLTLYLLQC